MIHKEKSDYAGKEVLIKESSIGLGGQTIKIEDWWDRVAGKSWMYCDGNLACLNYAIRSGHSLLPMDNNVLYGKIGGIGHLIHVSEITFPFNPTQS